MFETKYGPIGALLGRYVQYRAGPMIEAIFDGWAAEIDRRVGSGAAVRAGANRDPHARHPME